jgi:hypothetical protein
VLVPDGAAIDRPPPRRSRPSQGLDWMAATAAARSRRRDTPTPRCAFTAEASPSACGPRRRDCGSNSWMMFSAPVREPLRPQGRG